MPSVQSVPSPFGPAPIVAGAPAIDVAPFISSSYQTKTAQEADFDHAHSLAHGDSLDVPAAQPAIPSHVPLHWQLPELPDRDCLADQAKKLRPGEADVLLRQLPGLIRAGWSDKDKGGTANTGTAETGFRIHVDRGLPYPDASDTRSPHRIIQTALALALKDRKIDVAEACELRGLLLTLLPVASERDRYKQALAAAPMLPQAGPTLRDLDPDLSEHPMFFSKAEIGLINSVPFKLVFPNFTRLSLLQQRQVITELKVYLTHFPDLLPTLNGLRNDNYGPGFQFFFLDPEENSAFDKVIPKGVVGVVMPGANVVKDPILRLVADKVGLQQLDRGGLFINTIAYGVFSHEFAHVVHLNMLSDDQRDKIKNLYSHAWNRMRETGGKAGFVSEYAKTNPYEYFADGMEYYLCGGADKLKARDPELYAFISRLLAPGAVHKGFDGDLLSDPERVHMVVSQQGGRTLAGLSVSRESDLFSLRHFEGGTTQELAVLAGSDGAVARASLGLKAAWKPWDQPVGIYATGGGSVQAGSLKGVSIGAGGYAGVGVDYKFLNAEVRQNWMTGHNVAGGTEVRAGIRFDF